METRLTYRQWSIFKLKKSRQELINLNKPVNFLEFLKFLKIWSPNINFENKNYINEKYNFYFQNFYELQKDKRSNSKVLELLGFYNKSCWYKEYFISRGYTEEESKLKISNNSKTNTYQYIKNKNPNLSDIQINDKINKVKQNISKGLLNSNLGEQRIINITNGLKKRWKKWLTIINPLTNNFYTEDEAKIKQKEFNSQNSLKSYKNPNRKSSAHTIQSFQNKYGINEGLVLWELYRKKNAFTLENNICKYGLVEGTKRFELRQIKWQNTLNNKSDEEKLRILKAKTLGCKKYSHTSKIFFEFLIQQLYINNIKPNKIHYAETEYYLYDKENKKIKFYDFCIPEINFIIEYHGIQFHPNPILSNLNTWKCPISKRNANEIIENDNYKLKLANNNGFEIFYMWDTDDKYKILKNLIKIIKIKYDSKIINSR